MKRLAILGSTGSIGTQTLDVVRKYPRDFCVVSLTAGKNSELLDKQNEEFHPEYTSLGYNTESIVKAACIENADMVVNSLMGMVGVLPTYRAIEAGKDIAFANKETLVAAGSLIMPLIKKKGVAFLPVDSEHSAIFQCLKAAEGNRIKKIILTASGGPFRGCTEDQLKNVTKAQALKHPSWRMGAKITIDSATMMNKGLEIIEACWLFDVKPEQIEVVVHPQSAIHSAVEFEDGSIIAQLGPADMRLPISYALSYPERFEDPGDKLDLFKLAGMSFEEPDEKVFRSLRIAKDAFKAGKSYPLAMNAANEEAVAAFLDERIEFYHIPEVSERCLEACAGEELKCIEDVLSLEKQYREKAKEIINMMIG